jgi:hypothetical protein
VSTLLVAQPTLEGLEPERTLDDLLIGVWTRLSSHQAVECPACHGEMEPEYGAQALPIGGRCRSCGATLK